MNFTMLRTGLLLCSALLWVGCADDEAKTETTDSSVSVDVGGSLDGTVSSDATTDVDMESEIDGALVDFALADQALDQGIIVDAVVDATPQMDMQVCSCPGGQVCDGMGNCVEPEMCTDHLDCFAGRICKEGTRTDGCRENADCPGSLACDTASQECVELSPCAFDAHCLEGRICLDGSCENRCSNDADCSPSGNQICLVESGRCMAVGICTSTLECPGSQVCVDAQCINGCADVSDCAGAQECIDNVCTEPEECRRDVDCRGERVCTITDEIFMRGECQDPCMMDGCTGDLECNVMTGRMYGSCPL